MTTENGPSGVASVPGVPDTPGWWLYSGTGQALDRQERDDRWPPPPPWRTFLGEPDLPEAPADPQGLTRRIGNDWVRFPVDRSEVTMVNAALYLRRPLLVTGRPGSGKSSLAFRISRELGLGRVLQWSIGSRTTLKSGLYDYDAIGRVQAARRAGQEPEESDIGRFVHLGPLGTALLPRTKPRVLLVDEMDKSDIDLPNDLLGILEDGYFAIPELSRISELAPTVTVNTADPEQQAGITKGLVTCHEFPLIIITSNGEREFPAAFLRRCLYLEMPDPDQEKLIAMVAAHFGGGKIEYQQTILDKFQRLSRQLSTDQLLNALHLARSGAFTQAGDEQTIDEILKAIWHRLNAAAGG